MSDFAETDSDIPREIGGSASGYALSGRIMLSAIIILFFVVVLMVVLHLYARWYLLRARRRRFLRRNRHNRRTHLVFYVDPAATSAAASQGLDASVLKTLPLFKYSSGEPLECAVCLSEFEENETGRRLPKCSHSFHIDCIDMWFQSHNTCPLCRSPVEPVQGSEDQVQSAATEQESSGPAVCSTCHHDESRDGPAGPSGVSSGGRRKPSELFSVSIEVPSRGDLEDDLASESPATQFRSPVSRMLSFTRILSRERRGNVSPSTANCAGSEADLERGREENQPSQG